MQLTIQWAKSAVDFTYGAGRWSGTPFITAPTGDDCQRATEVRRMQMVFWCFFSNAMPLAWTKQYRHCISDWAISQYGIHCWDMEVNKKEKLFYYANHQGPRLCLWLAIRRPFPSQGGKTQHNGKVLQWDVMWPSECNERNIICFWNALWVRGDLGRIGTITRERFYNSAL